MTSTVEQLLSNYDAPPLASRAAGKVRSAGYHWYGDNRVIPSDDALLNMAEHQKLPDEAIESILLDASRRRLAMRRAKC
tara:strand:+ start:241 stop:477 length:237 start_codon:yes stop_codon:yes gene_type:complete